MAAIVAADVSAKILYRQLYAPDSVQPAIQPIIVVGVGITVDPGTDKTYPSGGIPLDNLFTSGNASDTKLDIKQPIYQIRDAQMQAAAATFSPSFPAKYEQGSTAATNVLRLRRPTGKFNASAATITGTTLAVASSTITDSGNGLVTAGFQVGDLIVVSGFTGTAANNTWGILTAVAAGTLTAVWPVAMTNDAAGEPVTVTAYRSGTGFEEFPLTDVTAAPLFNGDTDPYVELWLLGRLRAGESL